MNQAVFGGQPELIALADSLGVGIRTVEPQMIGRSDAVDQGYHDHGSAPIGIHLLYRPGHYDLAIPKIF